MTATMGQINSTYHALCDQFLLYFLQLHDPRVMDHRDPRLDRKLPAVRVHVGNDHMPSARKPRHSRRHDADRARARDEHVLSEHRK
jgi:hypothetical protein